MLFRQSSLSWQATSSPSSSPLPWKPLSHKPMTHKVSPTAATAFVNLMVSLTSVGNS